MSRAEELAAKRARLKVSTSAPPEVSTSVPTEVLKRAPRVKPVRLTVDVSPRVYVAWRQLLVDVDAYHGVAISGQDVLRLLIERVLSDDEARAHLERDLDRFASSKAATQ